MSKIDIKRIDTEDYYYYESINDSDMYTLISKVKNIEDTKIFEESKIFCKLLRKFTLMLTKDIDIYKPYMCKKYNISSRMFNTILIKAKSNVSSAKECAKLELERVECLIDKAEYNYNKAKEEDKVEELHGRQLRIDKLYKQKEVFKERIINPKIFYGRKIYKTQDKDKTWKEKFKDERDNLVGFIGSNDEGGGNTLKIKHIKTDRSLNREYFEIYYSKKKVGEFELKCKDAEEFINILYKNNQPFKYLKIKNKDNSKITRRKITTGRTALTIYLKKVFKNSKNSKWYVYISYKKDRNNKININNKSQNLLGIDLNIDSIAYSLIINNKFGAKPIYKTLTFERIGSNKRTELLCKYVRDIVDLAKRNNAIIVLEYLDFESSKKYMRNKLSGLLHMMPYKKIRQLFERRCSEAGVMLRYVRSNYTSLLGSIISDKYEELNRDEAAATIIGLRGSKEGNTYLNTLVLNKLKEKDFRVRYNLKGRYGINMYMTLNTEEHGKFNTKLSENSFVGDVQLYLGRVISLNMKTLNNYLYKSKNKDLRRCFENEYGRLYFCHSERVRRTLAVDKAKTNRCSTLSN